MPTKREWEQRMDAANLPLTGRQPMTGKHIQEKLIDGYTHAQIRELIAAARECVSNKTETDATMSVAIDRLRAAIQPSGGDG